MSNSEPKRNPLHFLGKRGRERGQNGSLEVVGTQLKRWRGHYFIYEKQEAGREGRKHKAVILGPRSKMSRKQAADALRAIIAEKSDLPIEKQPEMTFGSSGVNATCLAISKNGKRPPAQRRSITSSATASNYWKTNYSKILIASRFKCRRTDWPITFRRVL